MAREHTHRYGKQLAASLSTLFVARRWKEVAEVVLAGDSGR